MKLQYKRRQSYARERERRGGGREEPRFLKALMSGLFWHWVWMWEDTELGYVPIVLNGFLSSSPFRWIMMHPELKGQDRWGQDGGTSTTVFHSPSQMRKGATQHVHIDTMWAQCGLKHLTHVDWANLPLLIGSTLAPRTALTSPEINPPFWICCPLHCISDNKLLLSYTLRLATIITHTWSSLYLWLLPLYLALSRQQSLGGIVFTLGTLLMLCSSVLSIF